VKEYQENDRIRSKPDKNGKCGEAEKSLKRQPSAFVSKQYPDHVYALDKALYGLKEAPRAWYDVLSQFLIESGFQKGSIDTTLFIKKKGNDTYQNGKYRKAMDHYSDAIMRSIESRPFTAICLCNHAAAYQALGKVNCAIEDCNPAMVLFCGE
nr:reverse transcriptase [Tanacetum cinerariifolium]